MRALVRLFAFLSVLGSACTGDRGVNADALEAKAVVVVRDIFGGRYAEVRAEFDHTMLAALDEQQLVKARADYEDRFGTFEQMGPPEIVRRGDLTVINVPLRMSLGNGQARVTYDRDGKIAGLYLLRVGVPVP